MQETTVQNIIRLEAARLGVVLFRNNSGALYDQYGRLVRFGLGNDSAQLNRRIKSSDLIGFYSRVVTPEMVGQRVAIFTAIECKAGDWRGKPRDDREQAQAEFIRVVREGGGIGGFAASVADLYGVIK